MRKFETEIKGNFKVINGAFFITLYNEKGDVLAFSFCEEGSVMGDKIADLYDIDKSIVKRGNQ